MQGSFARRLSALLGITMFVAACGGAPGAAPTGAAPTAAATVAASPAPTTAPPATQGATGPANVDAPDSVEAGVEFDVTWTGPNGERDYVTIVPAGATEWTNEDYFYTLTGSPGKLTAPSVPGGYEVWYVKGVDESILARTSLTVTAFQGDLLAPDAVVGNTSFEVAWNGPNGPGDYVTIVKAGATKWTNEDYFYTNTGSPGQLTAPLEAGAYEIWYVIGSDETVQARRPITVTAATASVEAPKDVAHGAAFQVTWAGPDGPGDYVTIVPVGSAQGTYLSYAYTSVGNPATLQAPDQAGDYEVWYATGTGDVVLARTAIKVN